MIKQIFERATKKGTLICQIKGTEIEFFLNGNKIKKQSIAGINSVESLADKKFAKDIYNQLIAAGANAIWNYQVALYDDEADKIETAIKQARKEQRETEEQMIKNTDITVTEKLYNGAPAKAESEKFRWFFGQRDFLICKATGKAIYQMAYMRQNEFGSDNITDKATIAAVRKFWRDLRLVEKYAEEAYEQKQDEKEQTEFYENNPRLKGLTLSEIRQKEKEWDDLYNEGGEGYNPYRML